MAKALVQFKFRFLGNHFKEPSDYDEIPLRYCTLSEVRTNGGVKQIGTHDSSENGRSAWVALCAHPTHTDTELHIVNSHTLHNPASKIFFYSWLSMFH
jgi:hypothetical protein